MLKILNLIMIMMLLMFVGCDRKKDDHWLALLALAGSGGSGHGQDITFGYDVIAVYGSTIESTSAGVKDVTAHAKNKAKTSPSIDVRSTGESLKGLLTATNLDTSETSQFDWYGTLDVDAFQFTSTKTIVLNSGTYDFDLVLSNNNGNHTYTGHADGVILGDGSYNVDLSLAPVIGDTDVTITSSDVASLTLQYDSGEILDAGLTAPSIGVIVDGNGETEYVLNPQGKSGTTLDLIPGGYHLELKLYDTGIQRARSLANQEDVTVSANDAIVMDLVALHSQTTFSLLSSGGDATFHFIIPGDIVDEAGDLSNLETVFTYSGTANGLHSNLLTLNEVSGSYEASYTFNDFYYDTFTMELVFRDINDNEEIGSCIVSDVKLSESALSMDCVVVLRRRSLATGNLLATLGVNVFTDEGEAVSGAEIRVNGNLVGLTGEDATATAGFRKLYLVAGDYTIAADSGSQHGESAISLSALDVANVDVILGEAVSSNWTNVVDGSLASDEITGITSDSDGNLYIVGYTQGSIHGKTYYGNYDYFIAKYNRSGELLWSDQGITDQHDLGKNIVITDSGSIYIYGYTYGNLPGFVNQGYYDLFIVKYDDSGTKIWSKQYGSESSDVSYGIVSDQSEQIYITGYSSGSLNGGGHVGNKDIFMIKLDSDGNEIWTKQYGTTESDIGSDIALDDSGNIYITGTTWGDLDGSGNLGNQDIFITKFDSGGDHIRTKQFGTENTDIVNSLAVNADGDVYLAGNTQGNLNGYTNVGDSDAFLVKMDSDGNQLWTQMEGTPLNEQGNDVSLDSNGNVYLSCYTNGDLDGTINAGYNDVFLIKYDSSGNHIHTGIMGTPNNEMSNASTMTPYGVYVAGRQQIDSDYQYAIWRFDP